MVKKHGTKKPRTKKPHIPWKPKNNLIEQLRRAQMSRVSDLNLAESEIRDLEQEIQGIVVKYQTYHAEVAATVKDILVGAGVWDEIHDMETEREEVRQRADKKITDLRTKLVDLVKVRDWMVAREDAEKPVIKKAPPTPPDLRSEVTKKVVPPEVPAPPVDKATTEADLLEEAVAEEVTSPSAPPQLPEVRELKPRQRPVAPKV